MTTIPPNIRVGISAPFPSLVQTSGPLTIGKNNGVFTVGLTTGIQALATPYDPTTKQLLIFDQVTQQWFSLAASSFSVTAFAGGAPGQVQYNNAGVLGGFTVGGDATLNTGTGALTIAAQAVTYAKIQNVSVTSRFLGRITAGAGSTEEMTGTQATTLLDVFTSTLKGLVPASGGGTINFLRADNTFAVPPGGVPGGASGTIQYNNSSVFGGITNHSSDGTNITVARMKSTASLDWDSGAGAVDLSLFRDAANILAQRNGVNAQTLRVYNTFTDASNYERLSIGWAANLITIQPENAGSGTARSMLISSSPNLYIGIAGNAVMQLSSNTVQIGANRNIAFANTGVVLANGLNSNISLTGSFGRITGPTGAFSIGGFTSPQDGEIIKIFNTVAQTMTIVNEDASSTASNRITTLTGANIVLRATATSFASFIYDSGTSRWIVTATN